MASNPEIRQLLTAALLHLDPRIVDKRTALNTILIEVGLYVIKRPCEPADIYSEVDRIVNQSHFLTDEEFTRALSDCINRGAVESVDGKHTLTEKRAAILYEAFRSADAIMQSVKKELTNCIELETGEPLSPDVASRIFEAVRRIITEEVYEFALQLACRSLSIEEMVLQLEGFEPVRKIEQALQDTIPTDRDLLRKKTAGAIVDYFRQLSPDLEGMLRLIHHNVLINQILNLDPSMVRLQREWFSKRRLYLDTNVVLGDIFQAQKRHAVVKEVITASLNIGAQLLISPMTLQELMSQVDRAKRNHLLTQKVPLVKALASHGDDAILATYLQLLREQPSLDWHAFINPFENLEETLLQYNILVEEEGFNEAKAHPDLAAIRNAISDSKPIFVSPNVIDHDSVNCALILHLRQIHPPDERGQIVWLLTIDTSLRRAQRILHGSGRIQYPYCIQAADWGEIVLPSQNALGFVFNDFIGYLAQARLGAIAEPQIVQLDFLETIHDASVDLDRLLHLHPEQVRAALSTLQTNKEVRSLLTEAAQAKNDEERKGYQLRFDTVLNQAIEETDPVKKATEEYARKIDVLQKHLELRDKEIAELNKRISTVESSIIFRLVAWLHKLFSKG